jgi:hypothetical protein
VDPTGRDSINFLDDTIFNFYFSGLFAFEEAFVDDAINMAYSQAMDMGYTISVEVDTSAGDSNTGSSDTEDSGTDSSDTGNINSGSNTGSGSGSSTQTPSNATSVNLSINNELIYLGGGRPSRMSDLFTNTSLPVIGVKGPYQGASYRITLPGTNYCGPGGYGPVLNQLDANCYQHDACYANVGATWIQNLFGVGGNQAAIALCNQQLCNSLELTYIMSSSYQEAAEAIIVGASFGCIP